MAVTGRIPRFCRTERLGHRRRAVRSVATRHVDIFVTKECAARALDLAHELFTTLERRGHSVTLAPSERRYVRVTLDHLSFFAPLVRAALR